MQESKQQLVYYIDKYILAVIEGIEDEYEKIKLFRDYQSSLLTFQFASLEQYLVDKEADESLAQEFISRLATELTKTVEIKTESQSEDQLTNALMMITKEEKFATLVGILDSTEILDSMTKARNQFNQAYYERARERLSADELANLNSYLAQIDIQREEQFTRFVEETIKNALNVIKEEPAQPGSATEPGQPEATQPTANPATANQSLVEPKQIDQVTQPKEVSQSDQPVTNVPLVQSQGQIGSTSDTVASQLPAQTTEPETAIQSEQQPANEPTQPATQPTPQPANEQSESAAIAPVEPAPAMPVEQIPTQSAVEPASQGATRPSIGLTPNSSVQAAGQSIQPQPATQPEVVKPVDSYP